MLKRDFPFDQPQLNPVSNQPYRAPMSNITACSVNRVIAPPVVKKVNRTIQEEVDHIESK